MTSSDWKSTLQKDGYSIGLVHQLEKYTVEIPLRIWILDNSGSMNICDGYRFGHYSHNRSIKCTRWQELVDAIRNHAQLAAMTKAPTIYRLLNICPNIPSELSIAYEPIYDYKDMQQQVSAVMNSLSSIAPAGMTPLTIHIHEIAKMLLPMEHSLRTRNQYVSLIIATDGLPSDEKGYSGFEQIQLFINALRLLENLSVRLLIRLSTHEERVKKFYHDLRPLLRLPVHIIEDFTSEAKLASHFNPWVNYVLPLHRIKEFGVIHYILPLMKERSLTEVEMKEYCMFLFGPELIAHGIDPRQEFSQFVKMIKCIVKRDQSKTTGKLEYIILKQWGNEPCCSIL